MIKFSKLFIFILLNYLFLLLKKLKTHLQPVLPLDSPYLQTQSKVTQKNISLINTPPPEKSISKHLSFINELQSLITPLLSLLTSLINKLIIINDTQY